MKLRAILYALFIALLPVGAAECSTLEQVRADVATFDPPASLREMNKQETEAFLSVYNSMPPPSEARGDYSVAVLGPRYPVVSYVYFLNNCAIATLYMHKELFERMLRVALPEPKGQKA